MLQASIETLTHAVEEEYYEELPSALSSARALVELSNRTLMSAVERGLSRHPHRPWIVMLHFTGRVAAEALRQRQPSYFMNWPSNLACDAQVHVLDTPLYAKRYCQLVVFHSQNQPTDHTVNRMIKDLRKQLGLGITSRVVSTIPILKSKDIWFRPDGDLNLVVKDRILASELRSALSKQRGVDDQQQDASPDLSHLYNLSRSPMTYVLWTRQSNEDARRCKDSIPRQLTTILSSPVLETVQASDRLVVIVESCSSSKHPLSDRRLYHCLPTDTPIQLLTVNPDRLTRRASEVDTVLADLRGGLWHTSGLDLDEGSKEDWQIIGAASADGLKKQLALGMPSSHDHYTPTDCLCRPTACSPDGLLLETGSCDGAP